MSVTHVIFAVDDCALGDEALGNVCVAGRVLGVTVHEDHDARRVTGGTPLLIMDVANGSIKGCHHQPFCDSVIAARTRLGVNGNSSNQMPVASCTAAITAGA